MSNKEKIITTIIIIVLLIVVVVTTQGCSPLAILKSILPSSKPSVAVNTEIVAGDKQQKASIANRNAIESNTGQIDEIVGDDKYHAAMGDIHVSNGVPIWVVVILVIFIVLANMIPSWINLFKKRSDKND